MWSCYDKCQDKGAKIITTHSLFDPKIKTYWMYLLQRSHKKTATFFLSPKFLKHQSHVILTLRKTKNVKKKKMTRKDRECYILSHKQN